MQGNGLVEGVVTKAANKLGLDQLAIRRVNSPEGKARYGPPARQGRAPLRDARVGEGGARSRRRAVQLDRARRAGRKANRVEDSRRRRGGGAARSGIDRLRRADDHSAGRKTLRAVGHRQPRHPLGDRRRAGGRRHAAPCRGRRSKSSGAIQGSTCRGRACRLAARRHTR